MSELRIRMLLETNLNDEYDVTALENGYEAISWLQHGNRADLVLFDTDMTMINGYEFEQSIKKQKGMSCVPVIMFSTANNNHISHQLQQTFHPQKLISKINSAIGRAAA